MKIYFAILKSYKQPSISMADVIAERCTLFRSTRELAVIKLDSLSGKSNMKIVSAEVSAASMISIIGCSFDIKYRDSFKPIILHIEKA